jgi:hypothetical protein
MSLRYKREELATVSVQVSPREYQCTVLKSLPDELAKFASQALSSAHHSGHPLDTDTLINSVIKESEHLKNRCARSQQGQGKKPKEGQANEALTATRSEGSRQKRCPGNCHNCGKPRHWACKCRKPKKKKDSDADSSKQNESTTSTKPENKPVGSANVVIKHDFKGDGFWMAMEEDLVAPALDFGADPDLCLGDPDDLEGDAPDELNFAWDGPDDWLKEELSEIEGEELAGAVITPSDKDSTSHIELYDSSTTRHISPFKPNFTAYSLLSPLVFLNMANQQRFLAIGTGTLAIQVLNRQGETELLLKDALHVPSVGYTLMSLGTLDEEGYCAQIGGGYLEITSPCGNQIG